MTAMDPLCLLLGINPKRLSKEKNLFLEAECFARLYTQFENLFRKQHEQYFRLMKFNLYKENTMLGEHFGRLFMQQMLSEGSYTLPGIARYIDMPEELVREVQMGINAYPSAFLLRRVIELDRCERRDFYRGLLKESLQLDP